MRLHQTSLLFLTLFALVTGCSSMNHGDPKNPKKNPHPVKRYEVVVTADAPGPWDSVKGYLSFDVSNVDCVPQDSYSGARNVPTSDHDFEMVRVNEKTWKGYFYGDLLQDEDYFGKGVCHWVVKQAAPAFSVHGNNFVPSSGLENTSSFTEYFKKSDFKNHSVTDGGYGTTATDSEVAKSPDLFFPITVTVRELKP